MKLAIFYIITYTSLILLMAGCGSTASSVNEYSDCTGKALSAGVIEMDCPSKPIKYIVNNICDDEVVLNQRVFDSVCDSEFGGEDCQDKLVEACGEHFERTVTPCKDTGFNTGLCYSPKEEIAK